MTLATTGTPAIPSGGADDPVAATAAGDGDLSGLVVGRLSPGEQLVLWALRQRQADGGSCASPVLVHGFRLAFGLALLEPALAAFEGLHLALPTARFPLRCACVGAVEREALGLVAAAQGGEGPWLGGRARRLAAAAGAPTAELGERAVAFAALLRRAGLALPPLASCRAEEPRTALLH